MKGFIIPKGWIIYVYMTEINHDNFLYPRFLHIYSMAMAGAYAIVPLKSKSIEV